MNEVALNCVFGQSLQIYPFLGISQFIALQNLTNTSFVNVLSKITNNVVLRVNTTVETSILQYIYSLKLLFKNVKVMLDANNQTFSSGAQAVNQFQ